MKKYLVLLLLCLSLNSYGSDYSLKVDAGLTAPYNGVHFGLGIEKAISISDSVGISYRALEGDYEGMADYTFSQISLSWKKYHQKLYNGFYTGLGIFYSNIKKTIRSESAESSLFGPNAEIGYQLKKDNLLLTTYAIIGYGFGDMPSFDPKYSLNAEVTSSLDLKIGLMAGFVF